MSQLVQEALAKLESALALNQRILTLLEAAELDFEALDPLFEQKQELGAWLETQAVDWLSKSPLSGFSRQDWSALQNKYSEALIQSARSEAQLSDKLATLGSPQRLAAYIRPKDPQSKFDQSI